jgi:hypothetical protein
MTSYVQSQALAMAIEGNIQTAQMYGQMGEGYGQMGQTFAQVGQACANSNTAIAAQIAQVAPVVAAPRLVTPPDRPFELTEWRFKNWEEFTALWKSWIQRCKCIRRRCAPIV